MRASNVNELLRINLHLDNNGRPTGQRNVEGANKSEMLREFTRTSFTGPY